MCLLFDDDTILKIEEKPRMNISVGFRNMVEDVAGNVVWGD